MHLAIVPPSFLLLSFPLLSWPLLYVPLLSLLIVFLPTFCSRLQVHAPYIQFIYHQISNLHTTGLCFLAPSDKKTDVGVKVSKQKIDET